MPQLQITIEGDRACGKSTVAQFIEETLRARGFAVNLRDRDGSTHPRPGKFQEQSLSTVSRKSVVNILVKQKEYA